MSCISRSMGVDFTSKEGSFHPYTEGAGLNYVTEGIIFGLVLVTLILAYFVIRSQRKDRQKAKGEIGITEAKRTALEYLASFYKVKEEGFKFHDAYPSGGDGFEIVYTSPKGSIRYKVYVDFDGHVVRLMGGTRRT